MNKPIPLVEYFNRLAYPDGVPSRSFRAPPRDAADDPTWQSEYDAMTAMFAAAEKSAWEQIVSDALSERIEMHAFEYVQRNDPNAEWYPETYATTRTRIPPTFFYDDTFIGPMEPVVIYYTGRGKPNIFNAPWRDPIVIPARSAIPTQRPSNRPRDQRLAAIAVLRTFSPGYISATKRTALLAEVNQRLKADGKPLVEKDTLRRAIKELNG